jgi:hypothetical protein
VVPHIWGVAVKHSLGDLGDLEGPGLVGQMDLELPESHHGGSMQRPCDEVRLFEGESVF